MNNTATLNQSQTGLLVVHGIGEQRPGETVEKLINGLQKAYKGNLAVERTDQDLPLSITVDGKSVRLYEVYWADILSKERTQNTFQWDTVQALAWFPFYNRHKNLFTDLQYPGWLVYLWTLLLVPATLGLYLIYSGARLLAKVFESIGHQEKRPLPNTGKGLWADFKAASLEAADEAAHGHTFVEELLDAYAGDVSNYMFSACKIPFQSDSAHLQDAARDIQQRFYLAYRKACDDGCRDIHILAHSLGTVVTYHGITGQLLDAHSGGKPDNEYSVAGTLRHIYTIGSPLEKIRFIWPNTISERLLKKFTFSADGRVVKSGDSSDLSGIQWDNFYHRFDRVSGYLKRFNNWLNLKNHPIKSGGGLIRSHIIYEQSPEFIRCITGALFGRPAELKLSRWRNFANRLISVAENIALPLVVLLLSAIGAGLGMLVLLLPGYIFSLPFRIFGAYNTAFLVQNVFGGIMAFILLFGIFDRVLKKTRALHAQINRIE